MADFETLAALLRAHDASFDAAKVKAVYDDEQATGFVDWARLHLTPDTLLSIDELEQITALERSAKVEQLSAGTDLGTVQAFSDQEVKDAIQELERSTEAITRQTETLRQQQEALGRLVMASKQDTDARSGFESKHAVRRESSQKITASAVEDLTHALHLRISELEQQNGGNGNSLQQTVDTLLRSDDKLLSSLQKLGRELETEDPEEQENLGKLREICARLIKYTVEGIRTKLDRLYLESLEPSSKSLHSPQFEDDDSAAIQEELESLYAEILPVAQMSVEQQYLGPALKGLAARNGNSRVRSEQAVGYIHECLDYLLRNLDLLTQRADTFQGHQTAVSTLVGAAKAELSVKVEPAVQRERRPTVGASPIRRRKSSTGMSPFRPRANSKTRRRSSSVTRSDDLPFEELLHTLALNMPSQSKLTPSEARAQAELLASTLEDKIGKAHDVALNVQQTFEVAAITQMTDARLALQMIRDSILAESPYSEVRLSDPEIDSSITVLAQQLEDVRAALGSRSQDLAAARGRSVKKEDLLRRWGG